jgi:hypothetical protein
MTTDTPGPTVTESTAWISSLEPLATRMPVEGQRVASLTAWMKLEATNGG